MTDSRFTWMHSGQKNAPQMDGSKLSEGQILNVLDAALVDGFNSLTSLSATTDSSTVTLEFGVEHGFEIKQLLTISGATDAKLNGRHRVVRKTLTGVTVSAVGVTDATSGTVVVKVAPLGFQSIFGNTTPLKRAYRSENTQSTRTVLFLDASLPTGAGYNTTNPAKRLMVSLCQDMQTIGVEINSYTAAFNKKPTVKNGNMFWYQSRPSTKLEAATSSEFRSWVIVGNGDVFYLFNEWQDYSAVTGKSRDFYAFGDIKSLGGANDVYNCMWIGSMQPNDIDGAHMSTTGAVIGGDIATAPIGMFIKSHTGVGSLQPLVFTTNGTSTISNSGASTDSTPIPMPNPVSQSIVCFPVMGLTTNGLRGVFNNLYAIPQNFNNNAASYDLKIIGNILTVAVLKDRLNTSNDLGFYAIDLGD